MTDIFISYSRKDKVFTQLLHAALEAIGREAWIDWQDKVTQCDRSLTPI
jgi:hypothetical protein